MTSQTPETTYQSLEKYGRDLTALARQGKLDPVIGRDEEVRRTIQVLSPADQEQPGPDRRAGRRQDRDRRGPGAAHRPRRRARGPEGQADRRARPRARWWPARSTAASSRSGSRPSSRRSPTRTGRSSCSSTSSTPSSARARPKARWTPRTCSSRCSRAASCTASAPTTLDEYRKHIEKDAALERRFQPVLRRRADGRGHHLHPARAARALRAAPQGPHQGRRAGGGGRAVAPLHRRPLPARQGDRPGRRGGGQAAHGSDQHAGRARRGPAPDHAARDRARGPAQGEGRGVEGAAGAARAGAGRREGAGRPSSRRAGRARSRSSTRSAAIKERARHGAERDSSRPRCGPTGSGPPA